jgi:cardiolipin synthase A/B
MRLNLEAPSPLHHTPKLQLSIKPDLGTTSPTQATTIERTTFSSMNAIVQSKLRAVWALSAIALLLGSRVNALTLFETPDDKDHTIVATISAAKKSVDVEVYELTDADIISALIAKSKAGVSVRVILNPAGVGVGAAAATNAPAKAQLKAAGVPVRYSQTKTAGGSYDATHFEFDHAKIVISDAGEAAQVALITTINLSPSYLGTPVSGSVSLNFGVVDNEANDVAYLATMFACDWNKTEVGPPSGTDLVISPINARSTLMAQIKGAKKTIHFFNQELGDPQIIQALVDALGRKVEVEGLVSDNLTYATDIKPILQAGGQILALPEAPLYEHAKAAIIDGNLVYVGSINYTQTSLDNNREVGIEFADNVIAGELEGYFSKYWPDGVTVTAVPAKN